MATDEGMTDEGFDEAPTLGDDDLVELELPDGTAWRGVLLAVLEHGDATYALLTAAASLEDDEGELLVATFDEDATGAARFGTVDDDAVLEALQAAVGGLLGGASDDDEGAVSLTPIAEA